MPTADRRGMDQVGSAATSSGSSSVILRPSSRRRGVAGTEGACLLRGWTDARNFLAVSDPMIVSKLTAKAQTTIPKPARLALGLDRGDELV